MKFRKPETPQLIQVKWREQVERGWLQAQAGQVIDGDDVFRKVDQRIKQRGRKRA